VIIREENKNEAALDKATELTHDEEFFGDCQLATGYSVEGFQGTSRMRIWGDGTHRLPR
jgi:hypothetical protein